MEGQDTNMGTIAWILFYFLEYYPKLLFFVTQMVPFVNHWESLQSTFVSFWHIPSFCVFHMYTHITLLLWKQDDPSSS